MTKWTDGPWQVARMRNKPHHAQTHSNVEYCLLNIRIDNELEAEANARLIAAAPEMAGLLKKLVDHATERYPHFESERGQREIADTRALLAQIEGE